MVTLERYKNVGCQMYAALNTAVSDGLHRCFMAVL